MCNHSYTGDYAKRPRAMGQRCPYPDLFEVARSTAAVATGADPVPALSIDDRGACLFHSRAAAWKRRNDFAGQFLRLVRLLDADGAVQWYDFAEFVFVGAEPGAGGAPGHAFHLAGAVFRKQAYFIGAAFLDPVVLEGVDFAGGADFSDATFEDDLKVEKTCFAGIESARAEFRRRAAFTDVRFSSYATFDDARFTGTADGHVVTFVDTRFEGITSFSGAAFNLGEQSTAAFLRTRFDDAADFGKAQFQCHVVFGDVSFGGTTDFIDTSFDTVRSAARYRGCGVEFNRIEVPTAAVLTFKSTDARNKMFEHDVQMSFREDPVGIVRFENVNFGKILATSRERLTRLARTGAVEIGSGCIKYRFQTEVRTLPVGEGNAPLVIEICQTFTNYFTASSGLNLGLEVVERSATQVSFFYFTDEDISETTFFDRLADTEESLWDLLSAHGGTHLLGDDAPAVEPAPAGEENAVINAVDAVSAVSLTFFRVGVRMAFGKWKRRDTKALLGAIGFNDDDAGVERRAASLHAILIDRYTRRALAEFVEGQHRGLLPMNARRPPIDFVILTAIEVERRAACAAFGLTDRDRETVDERHYWRGRVTSPGGRAYQVVVAQPLEAGNVDAALLVTDVIRHWSPAAALFVGIAASTDPGNVKLGDVVVGKSVWYYEHGKVTPEGNKPQPEMIQADAGLLKHLVGLGDWDGAVPVPRPDGTDAKPAVSQGVIASGEKVVAHVAARDQIASGHRKILALEMEGYGFSRAVWQSSTRVRHLVMRGICDDGSPAKDDRWHRYAAAAAAAFARHFMMDRPL